MPEPAILASPFLTHSVLDTLLSKSPSPQDRIQLLSAKIHLYANDPASSNSTPTAFEKSDERSTSSASGPRLEKSSESGLGAPRRDADRIPEMRTRLDLAVVQLGEMKGTPASLAYGQQAEATLRIVLDWTRGAMKGIERRERVGAGEAAGIGRGVELNGNPTSTLIGAGKAKEAEGSDDSWTGEIFEIRRRALEMMIQLEEGMGRSGRIDALRKQLETVDKWLSEG